MLYNQGEFALAEGNGPFLSQISHTALNCIPRGRATHPHCCKSMLHCPFLHWLLLSSVNKEVFSFEGGCQCHRECTYWSTSGSPALPSSLFSKLTLLLLQHDCSSLFRAVPSAVQLSQGQSQKAEYCKSIGAASQRLCLPSAHSAAGHFGLIPRGEQDLAPGRLSQAFRLHQDTREVSARVFCSCPGASQNVLLHLLTHLKQKLPHPPQGTLATVTQGFCRCQWKCLPLPTLLPVQCAPFALQAAVGLPGEGLQCCAVLSMWKVAFSCSLQGLQGNTEVTVDSM